MEPLKVKRPLYDSHAHLTGPEVWPHLGAILPRALEAGVEQIMNICTDTESLERGLALEPSPSWPRIVHAGATTPHDVETEGEQAFGLFERAAREGKLAAIGETGLDYHYQHSNPKLQRHFLIRYLHLAAELKKPVIFHCREAFADLFAIVDGEYPKEGKAILHCFTGTLAEAEQVWERGWYLSLSGILTFKKSEALREVARQAPSHLLLLETDTPYLAPQTKRGTPNEPSFLVETAHCLAQIRGVSVDTIADWTTGNTEQAFS